QMPIFYLRLQLIAIIKIGSLMLLAEKQPVFSTIPARATLLQKTAKGSNASTRTNHDDGPTAIVRNPEIFIALYKNGDLPTICPIRQKCGANAFAQTLALSVARVTYCCHRQMNFVRKGFGAGRNRIKPWL